MTGAPSTWHYGLVAQWWAEFNVGGPEVEYYGQFVERGQPALDAGCGTGRLLLPWLRAGYDLDGCDVSADMIALCRAQARREGIEPTLLVQPLHELDPPRRYATIVACGVFGLGSTRAQDEEALRCVHRCLEPGGRLLLDMEVPYANRRLWRRWHKDDRHRLPSRWNRGEAKRTADGSELRLRSRVLDVDPLDQTVWLELWAEKLQHGACVASERHTLSMRMYLRDELLLLLERSGFADVQVRRGYADEEPTGDDDILVFVARKPAR